MHNLNLPENNLLFKEEEEVLLKKVQADFSYKETTREWRNARREELAAMGMESEVKFCQYMSLRHHLQRRKHHENFHKVKDDLLSTLTSLQDALKVAKTHEISPLETCKVVLRKWGWEWQDIMGLLPKIWTCATGIAGENRPSLVEVRPLLESLACQYADDGLTVEDLISIYECSLEDRPLSREFGVDGTVKFKERFENMFLSDSGIHYVTQEDLRSTSYNRRIAKPSFWFPKGILINGKLSYWVDCRQTYGSSVIADFDLKRMSKQVNGHKKAFGEGALIFHLGCSEDFRKEFTKKVNSFNTISFQIIDGSICPIENQDTILQE